MSLVFVVIAVIVLLFGFVVAFGAPYVPSLTKEVRAAFNELNPLTTQDYVVDLGSGDGSVLVEASKLGAAGMGVELNPVLILISRLRLRGRATIVAGNMWLTKLPAQTTLVYAFTVSRDTKKLEAFMAKEAIRLNKELMLMTFGAKLPGVSPIKVRKAHSLYLFKPLQAE